MKTVFKTSNFDKYYKDLVPYLKKEKNQQYFTIILSLTASIFFIVFAINPTISTIVNLRKQLTDAQFVDERLTQKINNLSSLSQQYQTIEGDIPLILDALPEKPEAPTLVGQIQTIGEDSSVQVNDIEILPINLSVKNSTTSSSFEFNVTGEGSSTNIQEFLKNLISITSIQFVENSNGENLSFVIKGLAYFKK